jgi:hypothetical protein
MRSDFADVAENGVVMQAPSRRVAGRRFYVAPSMEFGPVASLVGNLLGKASSMHDRNPRGVNPRVVLLAAAGAAPLLALGATAAKAAGLPQSAVAYQASPKDGHQCDGCSFFIAPNACKSVSGAISPTGWCKLWVKKA